MSAKINVASPWPADFISSSTSLPWVSILKRETLDSTNSMAIIMNNSK